MKLKPTFLPLLPVILILLAGFLVAGCNKNKDERKDSDLASIEKLKEVARVTNGVEKKPGPKTIIDDSEFTPVELMQDYALYNVVVNETADTVVAHLQTSAVTSEVDKGDRIHIKIYGENSQGAAVNHFYKVGSSTVKDIGASSDIVCITGVPIYITEIDIVLEATGARPYIIEGSWLEIKNSQGALRIFAGGDYSYTPGGWPYHDEVMYGQLGQGWALAHGYHWSLRQRSDLKLFNIKQFSHLDTVGDKRKADVLMRVSWAGTADKNVVSPTGVANYGYYIGAGISDSYPPDGIIVEQQLAKGGASIAMDYAETIADAIYSEVQSELLGQMLEDAVGEEVPGVGEALSVLDFLDQITGVDEKAGDSRWVKFQDVPMDQNSEYYAWIGLGQMARAAGTATAYVNFMYNGDPFLSGHEDMENLHQKGVWLQDILVYYQPVEMPRVVIENPAANLYAEGTSIWFRARAEEGDAPYSYEWKRITKDDDANIIDETVFHTTSASSRENSFSHQLPVGKYLITAKVTDENGASDSDSMRVEVLAPPASPVLQISDVAVETFEPYFIEWAHVDGASYYVVEESDDGTNWTSMQSQTWLYDSFLKQDVGTFYYRVKAYNKLDVSSAASNVVSTVVSYPPAEAVSVDPLPDTRGSGQVYGVHWERGDGIDYGYKLYEYKWVNLTGGDTPTLEKQLVNEITYPNCNNMYIDGEGRAMCQDSFSHTATESETYEYQVARLNAGGEPGPLSNSVNTLIVPPPSVYPTLVIAPNSVSRTVYYSVGWKVDVNEATEYCIDEDTSPAFPSPYNICTDPETGALAFQHDPATTTTYYYRILAENIGGPGPWSPTETKTVTVGVTPAKPSIEKSIRVANPGETYTIAWSMVDAEHGYELQESTDSSFAPQFTQNYLWGVPTHEKSLSNSPDDTTDYYYRVRGFVPSKANGPWSDKVKVQVIGTQAPSPPILKDAGGIGLPDLPYDICWEYESDAQWLILEENTDPTFDTPPLNSYGSMPGYTTCLSETHYKIVHSPSVTTNYYYRLKKTNGFTSGWSNVVQKQIGVPDCGALGIPVPGTPVMSAIMPSEANDFTPFKVEWSTASDAAFYELQEDPGDVSYCDFPEPSLDVYFGSTTKVKLTRNFDEEFNLGFCYRVRAWNACGHGSWSNYVDVGYESPFRRIIGPIELDPFECLIYGPGGLCVEFWGPWHDGPWSFIP